MGEERAAGNQKGSPWCLIIYERKGYYLFPTFPWGGKVGQGKDTAVAHSILGQVLKNGERVEGAILCL